MTGLMRGLAHLLADIAAQVVGLLALVGGLFLWAYTDSGWVALAVVVIGLIIAGWVSTVFSSTRKKRGGG